MFNLKTHSQTSDYNRSADIPIIIFNPMILQAYQDLGETLHKCKNKI